MRRPTVISYAKRSVTNQTSSLLDDLLSPIPSLDLLPPACLAKANLGLTD
jgi:hypothetical protein